MTRAQGGGCSGGMLGRATPRIIRVEPEDVETRMITATIAQVHTYGHHRQSRCENALLVMLDGKLYLQLQRVRLRCTAAADRKSA